MIGMEPASSPLDRPIATTIFPTFTARRKHDTVTSFRDLAGRILKTTRPAKGQLPWLKLARFGDRRTPETTKEDGTTTGGSLRNNANLLAISGVEGDYDGEKMGVDEAVALLRNAGLCAMVYTSPSHSEDAPRWRVLCPLSTDRTPDTRERLLARMNGALGGVLSVESFTLSQSYYFGCVKKNPK